MCTTSAVFSSPRFDSLHLGRAIVSQVVGLIIRIVMRATTRTSVKIIMNAAIRRTIKMIISVNLGDKPHNFPRRNKKVDCTTKQPPCLRDYMKTCFKGLILHMYKSIVLTLNLCRFYTRFGDIPYRVLSFMMSFYWFQSLTQLYKILHTGALVEEYQ